MSKQTIQDRLMSDQKAAMRDRDALRLQTVRSVRAAIQTREIEARTSDNTLKEDDVIAVLQKQAKQRRDSIEQFEKAGRTDLSEREAAELAIIEEYLPKPLRDDEIESVIADLIDQTGALSLADLGKVMGPVMQQLRGKADGRRVQELVRVALSNNT